MTSRVLAVWLLLSLAATLIWIGAHEAGRWRARHRRPGPILTEFDALLDQILELPHAHDCATVRRGDPRPCTCPLWDVVELVDDRILMLREPK